MGTLLSLSSTFHPQTDGQMERVNQVIEDMICAYVGNAPDIDRIRLQQ